jgi:hypothetical protein
MSEQMSFVYVETTGHVLAVATLVAAPKTPPVAPDLASPTLIVRNLSDPAARFDLTPDVLAVFTGDPVDAALGDPRGYSWDPAAKQIQSLIYGTKTLGLTLRPSSIDVDLGQISAGATKVLVAYAGSDPSKSEIAPGQVASGSQKTSVATGPLHGGTYVLVLAAGFPPAFSKV